MKNLYSTSVNVPNSGNITAYLIEHDGGEAYILLEQRDNADGSLLWVSLFGEDDGAVNRDTVCDTAFLERLTNSNEFKLGVVSGQQVLVQAGSFEVFSEHLIYNSLQETLTSHKPTPPIFAILFAVKNNYVLQWRKTSDFGLASIVMFPSSPCFDHDETITPQRFANLLRWLDEGTIKPFAKIKARSDGGEYGSGPAEKAACKKIAGSWAGGAKNAALSSGDTAPGLELYNLITDSPEYDRLREKTAELEKEIKLLVDIKASKRLETLLAELEKAFSNSTTVAMNVAYNYALRQAAAVGRLAGYEGSTAGEIKVPDAPLKHGEDGRLDDGDIVDALYKLYNSRIDLLYESPGYDDYYRERIPFNGKISKELGGDFLDRLDGVLITGAELHAKDAFVAGFRMALAITRME